MDKIKWFVFIIVILFFDSSLYCQKFYREGYIVKNNGESINGVVEYSSNQDDPSKCAFKRFDIAHLVTYTPEDIQAFGYRNGNRYESKTLNNKSLFFEVIVTGKIILYRRGSGFYIDKDKSGIVELKNGPVSYPVNGKQSEFNNLTEFLNYITEGKTGGISDKFNLKKDLIPLIIRYNKESLQSYYVFNRSISEKQLTQSALENEVNKNRIGLQAGMSIYKLNLGTPDGYYKYFPAGSNETAPVIGLSYERLLFRRSDKYSLKLGALYNRQSFYSYSEGKVTGGYSRDDAFFNFTAIKLPLLVQYSVTGNRLVPFINAGVAFNYILKGNYLHVQELENTSSSIIDTFENSNIKIRTGEASALAGLGLRTRLINNMIVNFEGRVEYGTGFLGEIIDPTFLRLSKLYKQNSLQFAFLVGISF
jgi:hypothetical protein